VTRESPTEGTPYGCCEACALGHDSECQERASCVDLADAYRAGLRDANGGLYRTLAADAVRVWGADHQLCLAQEEAGELVAEISRFRRMRSGLGHVAEEAADVAITAAQVRLIAEAGGVDFPAIERHKLARLRARIAQASNTTTITAGITAEGQIPGTMASK